SSTRTARSTSTSTQMHCFLAARSSTFGQPSLESRARPRPRPPNHPNSGPGGAPGPEFLPPRRHAMEARSAALKFSDVCKSQIATYYVQMFTYRQHSPPSLRSQDVLVAVWLALQRGASWTYAEVATALRLSSATVHQGVARLASARLI